MTTEKKLLRDVTQNPTDDEPRLVLADYYQERGNPRGDLIRVQCEMEELDWDDPRYIELEDLEEKLILKHRAKWLKELPKLKGVAWGSQIDALAESTWGNYYHRKYFRRGFVELITVKDFPSYNKNIAALKKHAVGGFVQMFDSNHRCYSLLKKQKYVRGTTFSQTPLNTVWLSELKHPEQFQALSASECRIDAETMSKLAKVSLPNLRSLDLQANSLNNYFPEFLSWDALANLRWLNIGLNGLGGEIGDSTLSHIRNFSKQKSFENLFGLNLWSNRLEAPHIKLLAKSPAFNRLVFLSLYGDSIGDQGIKHLLKGKCGSLRFLNLYQTDIGHDAIALIASSKKMSNLKRLNIAKNSSISTAGFEMIAKSKYLSNLTHLNFPDTKFTERAAKGLIDSDTLNSIRYLNIGDAKLKPTTIKALQKRFPKAVVKKPYD